MNPQRGEVKFPRVDLKDPGHEIPIESGEGQKAVRLRGEFLHLSKDLVMPGRLQLIKEYIIPLDRD